MTSATPGLVNANVVEECYPDAECNYTITKSCAGTLTVLTCSAAWTEPLTAEEVVEKFGCSASGTWTGGIVAFLKDVASDAAVKIKWLCSAVGGTFDSGDPVLNVDNADRPVHYINGEADIPLGLGSSTSEVGSWEVFARLSDEDA